ncbi:unnamed protein product [Prorocentrum cordatum]|uniref:Sulfhydryl oxidase n=1 Tax=Prorocentrum cordatum TaxID=2364126 RepID=A0ABN9W9S8_9DINO|nr:unnamed protein product [Polarella glacialis]
MPRSTRRRVYLMLLAEIEDYPTLLLCRVPEAAGERAPKLPSAARDLKKHLDGETLAAFESLSQCLDGKYESDVQASGAGRAYLSAKDLAVWVSAKTGLEPTDASVLDSGADLARKGRPVVSGPPFAPGWQIDSQEGEPGTPRFSPQQRWYDAITGFAEAVYFSAHRPGKLEKAVAMARFLSSALPTQSLVIEEPDPVALAAAGLGKLADALEQVDTSKGRHVVQKQIHSAVSAWTDEHGIGDPRDAFDEKTGHEIARFHTASLATSAAWALFHVTATAVAARAMSGETLLMEDPGGSGSDGDVAGAVEGVVGFVRDFVDGFLSCRHCKAEFLRRLDACAYGVCDISDVRQLPLWLWRAHNAVSLEQAARDEAEVDRRWPGYQDCPACWREEVVLGGLRTSRRLEEDPPLLTVEELDSSFDTGHVFWHMVATYVGVRRVNFELEDLPPEEQERVQGLLDGDKASPRAPSAAPSPRPTPAAGEPAAAAEGAPVEGCKDSPGFTDELAADAGLREGSDWTGSCEDWAPFDCSRAAEDWGFTPEGEEELLRQCPRSCGLCRQEAAHSRVPLVGATALSVVVTAVFCYLVRSAQRCSPGQVGQSRTPIILSSPQGATPTAADDDEEDPAQE